ncbi:DEAD/DEAH box helicase [Paenibacillus sp. MMS18-CY102]|uniref:DEAD/DEAH box helicase n=1 Tax=Paenibacillus sp. MMS18-CY102 TaxID=2682849 RepID=UPI00136576A1|nr:DEAD/DEAH box helicase [Paenibacillus sp. MMS18-CY102]MWC28073.1 DEAD/DEAH box helicase [Paenibacillus sp. MMS18-CY102]
MPLAAFHPVITEWFTAAFGEPTDVQVRSWQSIHDRQHTLIAAPTGSGKTLAALLPCLDAVVREKLMSRSNAGIEREAESKPVFKPGVRVLYLSPLKALNNDVHDHLLAFISAIDKLAAERETDWPGIRCAVRTGDTPSSQRASMAKRPPEVLLTTPESLYILLTSAGGRDMLRTVQHVIVDEIHDLAADKRGSHLSLSLERLVHLCGRPVQRIGVSATQKPLWRVGRFLGGWAEHALTDGHGSDSASELAISALDETGQSIWDNDKSKAISAPPHPLGFMPRPVSIVESTMRKTMQAIVTMPDMSKPVATREAVWQPILERLFSLMEGSRTVLLFVNSRRICERLCLRLNDAAGYEMARAHHGSMAKERRLEAERLLKTGELRCIVATSSLELGIDVGHVDLVLQIDPPFDAAAGIQRIGRAGHSVGDISRGAIIVRHRGALPEAAVLSRLIVQREIEPIQIPQQPLDVLSQQTVAMAANSDWTVEELYRLIVHSDTFRAFPRERLIAMLKVLSGFYPFARPLLDWNRDTDVLTGRRAGGIAALTGAGTIPSSSAYPVHHQDSRAHLGELDEEYVQESRVGDVFQLGSNNWMIRRIDKDRVYVAEAANSFSEIPFWRNEAGGRSIGLGLQIGAFVRELAERLALSDSQEGAGKLPLHDGNASDTAETVAPPTPGEAANQPIGSGHANSDAVAMQWLHDDYGMDGVSAEQLIGYIRSQHAFCGLPTDRRIIVEHYRDVSNQTHVIIHNPFGRRLNRTWLLAIERQFEQLLPYRLYGNAKDNGIEFVLPEWDPSWLQSIWHVTPDNLEPLLNEAITSSPLLAIAFRHLAETSLLLSRSFTRTPLWQKRLRSEELLKEALPYASQFPFLDEAMRECMNSYLDLEGLRETLQAIGNGQFEFMIRETAYPSPMATQFIAEYVNMRIYEGDGLDDIVRMQLLNVSRELAGKVFGTEAVSGIITPEILEEERLKLSAAGHTASDANELLALLKRYGDHGIDEIIRWTGTSGIEWVEQLSKQGAIEQVNVGQPGGDGPIRWISRDERELYAAFPVDPVSLTFIIGRYAEHELSITEPELCDRYPQLSLAAARDTVDLLISQGRLEQAPFASDAEERLWTGRRTAARLIRLSINETRKQAKPIHPSRWLVQMATRQYALSGLQVRGEEGLRAVIGKLQGLYLPLSHWESIVFPSRIADYRPEQLDLLCASGDVIWLGSKASGDKEGRVAFFLVEDKALYEPYTAGLKDKPSEQQPLLDRLRTGGAAFLTKLARDDGRTPSEVLQALLQLVWEGQASNDQFAPLRLHASKKQRDWAKTGSGLGRWYWTGGLAQTEEQAGCESLDATQAEPSAMHWVRHLLDSYGIVTKELVATLSPFSWDQLLPILKQLEEWGTVTRGVFVDGEATKQFTTPAIAKSLRTALPLAGDNAITILSAVDPVNPYGLIADWPRAANTQFARKIGHFLIMRGEQWLYWIENNGKRIRVMDDAADGHGDGQDIQALRIALTAILRRQHLAKIVIEQWNSEPVLSREAGSQLLQIGAEKDGQRLVLWPSALR